MYRWIRTLWEVDRKERADLLVSWDRVGVGDVIFACTIEHDGGSIKETCNCITLDLRVDGSKIYLGARRCFTGTRR